MTVGEERLRLGERRRLVFENFCELVPKESIAEEFQISAEQVERDIAFVAKKIREFRHLRCCRPAGLGELRKIIAEWERGGKQGPRPSAPRMDDPMKGVLPPISCDTEADILVNRVALLQTLAYIGPETLSTELILPTLTTHSVENVAHLKEAAHAVHGNLSEVA